MQTMVSKRETQHNAHRGPQQRLGVGAPSGLPRLRPGLLALALLLTPASVQAAGRPPTDDARYKAGDEAAEEAALQRTLARLQTAVRAGDV